MSRWGIDSRFRVYLEERFQSGGYEWEVRVEGERFMGGCVADRRSGLVAIERAIAELLGI